MPSLIRNKDSWNFFVIEHSVNEIIMNFESEVGSGVVQFVVQQTLPCKKSSSKNRIKNVIFAAGMFVERWIGILQVQSRFQTARIAQ